MNSLASIIFPQVKMDCLLHLINVFKSKLTLSIYLTKDYYEYNILIIT